MLVCYKINVVYLYKKNVQPARNVHKNIRIYLYVFILFCFRARAFLF